MTLRLAFMCYTCSGVRRTHDAIRTCVFPDSLAGDCQAVALQAGQR